MYACMYALQDISSEIDSHACGGLMSPKSDETQEEFQGCMLRNSLSLQGGHLFNSVQSFN
jgi:hypothetical protein